MPSIEKLCCDVDGFCQTFLLHPELALKISGD